MIGGEFVLLLGCLEWRGIIYKIVFFYWCWVGV